MARIFETETPSFVLRAVWCACAGAYSSVGEVPQRKQGERAEEPGDRCFSQAQLQVPTAHAIQNYSGCFFVGRLPLNASVVIVLHRRRVPFTVAHRLEMFEE